MRTPFALSVLLLVAVVIPVFALPVMASTPVHAPNFELPTREGATVSLDSLAAKVVVVDFWASWCEPCRKSFPWLAELHQRYSGKGLVIVAINLDKKREPAESFLSEYPAPFLVAFDPAGVTAEKFHVKAMPTSFVLDGSHRIVLTHPGFDPKKTDTIETLIREACEK
jgi:thiol-disulfide isomerase/thioredoxin